MEGSGALSFRGLVPACGRLHKLVWYGVVWFGGVWNGGV